jgi:hypothetical protein
VKPTAEGALRESRQSERAVVGNTGASSGVELLRAYIVGEDNEDSFPIFPPPLPLLDSSLETASRTHPHHSLDFIGPIHTYDMASSPQGLLNLPNELLREVVAPLSPSDLRHLRRVNHRVRDFILDYNRPRFIGLADLPDQLVLKVAQHLHNSARSQLARTTFRFYPLIMDVILDQEVRTQNVKLLKSALETGSKGLTRRLLLKGADVEARIYCHTRYGWRATTPLSFAAIFGDVQMVELLLQFGADVHKLHMYATYSAYLDWVRGCTLPLDLAVHFGYARVVDLLLGAGWNPVSDGKVQVLSVAIMRRHEAIVKRILQALELVEELSVSIVRDLLQMASGAEFRSLATNVITQHEQVILRNLSPLVFTNTLEAPEDVLTDFIKYAAVGKLTSTVRHLLQIKEQLQIKQTRCLDTALYSVISVDACKENVLRRELHQDVYQIVDILLAHGANPDAIVLNESARNIAPSHPDPRVRNRLMRRVRPDRPTKESSLRIGHECITPSQVSSRRSWRVPDLPSASLWDYVGPCGRENSGEDHGSDEGSVPKDNVVATRVTTLSAPTKTATKLKEPAKPRSNAPLPSNAFPPLATPKLGSLPPTPSVWAKASSKIRSAPTVKEQSSLEKSIVHSKPDRGVFGLREHESQVRYKYIPYGMTFEERRKERGK